MMDNYNIKQCTKCTKPLYPAELSNKDRKTWCSCDTIGVETGWSGYVEKIRKWETKNKDRRSNH